MVGRKVGYMCSLQSISERRASPEWRRSITTAFSNAMLNSSTCMSVARHSSLSNSCHSSQWWVGGKPLTQTASLPFSPLG